MHPPALLPEMLAASTLPRYAHSALPGAPVRPDRRRGRAAGLARSLRRFGPSASRRRTLAPIAAVAPVVAESNAG